MNSLIKILRRIYLKIFNSVNINIQILNKKVYYPLLFKSQDIKYTNIPIIRGKLKIINLGECTFGNGLIFNSSFDSNPIGLHKKCTIYISKSGKLSIDDKSGFSGVSIYCSNSISIGKNLFCGGNVSIWDTDFHSLNYALRRTHDEETVVSLPVNIGDDVFIGANSLILKGVTIGCRSIIGAGSVVTKNIPEDQIWAGNPVKFIKSISHQHGIY